MRYNTLDRKYYYDLPHLHCRKLERCFLADEDYREIEDTHFMSFCHLVNLANVGHQVRVWTDRRMTLSLDLLSVVDYFRT